MYIRTVSTQAPAYFWYDDCVWCVEHKQITLEQFAHQCISQARLVLWRRYKFEYVCIAFLNMTGDEVVTRSTLKASQLSCLAFV